MSIPQAGGSYTRKPDGTLTRVAFTEPRPEASSAALAPKPVAPPAPIAPSTLAPAADPAKTTPKG